MGVPSYPAAQWPASGTTSSPVPLATRTVCGFYIPSGFSGTTVSFKVCDTLNGTYVPLCDEFGATITYTVAASTYCRVKAQDFTGILFIQVVSGTSEAAGREVKLAGREFV